MSTNLIQVARALESAARNLDAVVVPLATGGGRGMETPDGMLRAELLSRMSDMVRAIDDARRLLV